MVNDPDLTNAACATLRQVLGEAQVPTVYASHPFNGEDFALFQEQVPGAMSWLGVANPEKGINGIPHHPQFGADEQALVVGTKGMAAVVLAYLGAD